MKQTNFEWLLTLDEAHRVATFRTKRNELSDVNQTYDQDAVKMIDWLASPRIEPITLTAEERKAAELAVAIGLPWISKSNWSGSTAIGNGKVDFYAKHFSGVSALADAEWITAEPICLRELLKEGTI